MAKRKESVRSDTKEPSPVSASIHESEVKYYEDFVIDMRTVTISLKEYANIVPFYVMGKIDVKAEFMGKSIGESDKIKIVENTHLDTDIVFKFSINAGKLTELNKLLSNPVVLTVTQYPGKRESAILAQLDKIEGVIVDMNQESLISMYEAFTDEKFESIHNIEVVEKKDTKAPSKKGGKDKQQPKKVEKPAKKTNGGKSPKKDKAAKKSRTSVDGGVTVSLVDQPVIIGVSTLDFLPFFYGKQTFTETLLVNPIKIFTDDRMITHKNLPSMTVSVNISTPFNFDSVNILNFTMESIYNIPGIMGCMNMEYKVCVMLPMDSGKIPLLITNGILTTKPQKEQMKCWPGLERIGYNANTTRYQFDLNTDNIKNRVGEDLKSVMESMKQRIEFNYIYRNLLQTDDCMCMVDHLKKYRKFAVEILMSNKVASASNDSQSTNSKEGKQAPKGKATKKEKPIKEKEYTPPEPTAPEPCFLHLVAFVDLGYLLNPGVKKIRVACPVSTFHYKQALTTCGLVDAFFIPKPITTSEVTEVPVSSPKLEKKKGKGSKDDSAEKSSKGSKKSTTPQVVNLEETPEKNLKSDLPSAPFPEVEEEPSSEVYNENGERCFIIVEIELARPLIKKREIDDLNEQLHELLPEKPQLCQIAMSTKLAEEYYKGIVNQLAADLNEQYINYSKEKSDCICPTQADFETYLRRIGVYQKYLNTLIQAAAYIVENKFQMDGNYTKNDKIYQGYIGEIYSYLVSDMNCILNKCAVPELVQPLTSQSLDKLLFYAREATELEAHILAERYYMERLCGNKGNPNYWFDYAIYKIQINDRDRAFECVQEALAKNLYHSNSLLLYGILLLEKQKKEDAETCFLTLLVNEPNWVEAWGVLYLFYQLHGNVDGMELCQDMADKNLDVTKTSNYLMTTEDLAWSPDKLPNTLFFRTAILLMKMRIFEWAESALAHEIMKYNGLVNYLLAVKSYYKRDFIGCREYIEITKRYYGKDCHVASLSGHCFLAMDMLDKAEKEYSFVISSFSRREDIHLVYINYARILAKHKNHHLALKLSLIACKLNPTPYTWLSAGISYYEVNDFLSAEECFTEANMRDNRIAETWAYLTLINLKFHRNDEAEICYQQILKNSLNNPSLMQKVEEERKRL